VLAHGLGGIEDFLLKTDIVAIGRHRSARFGQAERGRHRVGGRIIGYAGEEGIEGFDLLGLVSRFIRPGDIGRTDVLRFGRVASHRAVDFEQLHVGNHG